VRRDAPKEKRPRRLVQPRRAVGKGKGAGARPRPYEPGSTRLTHPLTKKEGQEGLASVGCVIRPVIAVRPIVGIRRIDRRVIGGRRIIAIDGRIVGVRNWIRIAPVITSSPAHLLDSGL
jgi:hypothetical protein